MTEEFELEAAKLDKIIHYLQFKIDELENEYKTYSPYTYKVGDMLNDLEFEIKKKKAIKMRRYYEPKMDSLLKIKSEPYFGKIYIERSGKEEEVYIGQEDISDQENNQVVVSWMTEYGNLFYKRVPFSEFKNGDEVSVDKTRHFTINNSQLIDYKDYKIVKGNNNVSDSNKAFSEYISSDFLQNELVKRNVQKLQPIFQTIDQKQNDVVRTKISETLVVQGVSGSGKTTMGLQRLSYIIYHFAKTYDKAPEILALCPNDIFLDYIQDLIPNLNLQQVQFSSFEEFFLDLLPDKFNIKEKTIRDDLTYHFTHELDSEKRNFYSEWFKFKGSKSYAELLETFVKKKKEVLYALDFDHIHPSLNRSRMNRIMDRANNLPFNEMIEKIKSITKYNLIDLQKTGELFTELDLERGNRNNPVEQLFGLFDREISSYKLNTKKAYTEFLSQNDLFKDQDSNFIKLNNKLTIHKEDIPAISYLSYLIDKFKVKKKFDHIFVDEGQDMNYVQYLILKYCARQSSLTIVGDLNQQIYLQSGIGNWDNIRPIYDFKFITLDYNYRSSKEIMDLASSCLIKPKYSGKGILETELKPVQYVFSTNNSTEINWINLIQKYLSKWLLKKGSIAIITNSIDESEQIENHLNNLGVIKTNVIRNSASILMEDKITILSTLQVKGLEFNHVLIYNPSENEFPYDDYSSKLLYMAMTRALHNLVFIIDDPPTKLLEKANSKGLFTTVRC